MLSRKPYIFGPTAVKSGVQDKEMNSMWPRTQLRLSKISLVGTLFVLYLISRLYQLDSLPPFIDETIHVMYANDTLNGNIMVGLWDGRWLPIKIMALFTALPGHDLFMIRLSSVVIGMLIVAMIMVLGNLLASFNAGVIAGAVYVLVPYALFHDRLGLVDTYQTLSGCIVAILSIQIIRSPKRLYVMLLPVAIAIAILVKIPALTYMAIPIGAVITLSPVKQWKRLFLRIAPSLFAGVAVLGVLLWRGFGFGMWQSGEMFSSDPAAISELFLSHLGSTVEWFWLLFTPPIFLLAVMCVIWLLFRGDRRTFWFLLALLAIAVGPFLIGRSINPRYIHFALVSMALLMAMAVDQWSNLLNTAQIRSGLRRFAFASSAVLLLLWPVWLDSLIVSNRVYAQLPDATREDFIAGWTSGYGLVEVAQYLQEIAEAEPRGINVMRFYYWNHENLGLNLYLVPSDELHLITLDPAQPDFDVKFEQMILERPSYLVRTASAPDEFGFFNQVQNMAEMTRIWYYPKPNNLPGLEVWQLSINHP
jgi:hypothetical protein